MFLRGAVRPQTESALTTMSINSKTARRFVAVALCAGAAVLNSYAAEAPAALTISNIVQVRRLSADDLDGKTNVRIQATVTYFSPGQSILYVEADGEGMMLFIRNRPSRCIRGIGSKSLAPPCAANTGR